MRLSRARVQKYRSIRDSGWFEVEPAKTILVGPNEAGKTVLLKALEQIHHGTLVKPFEPLRDYPRSEYHELQSGRVEAKDIQVVEAEFDLDEADRSVVRAISPTFDQCRYWRSTSLDNKTHHALLNTPALPTVGSQKDSLRRLATHADGRLPAREEGAAAVPTPSEQLNSILQPWADSRVIGNAEAAAISTWLDTVAAPPVDEASETETERLKALRDAIAPGATRDVVLAELSKRVPIFIYFSTYTRVTPMLHLGHLADAIDAGAIDEGDAYNFGNFCLLKLLNFSARKLSDLGKSPEPAAGDRQAFERYRAQLDERDTILNAASLRLTQQIKEVWQPAGDGGEPASSGDDYTIRIRADQQYLKVVVEDSLGVEVELDQRSEGFQWLVSFFIVFFAQAHGRDRDAILLLDEPGLSLHGLKQREFRLTLSRLAESNQLLFTTHSPFLVGPDELDLVRVVEMADRRVGSKVHTEVMADDPASLLPLQEALGYDLAQSLFAQQRNLVLEGLTDFWYVEATADLLRESGKADLNEQVALIPAGGTGKIVYFATILYAHHLKVAALLDSDAAGEQAAKQETLVHTLGNKRILRTRDSYTGPVGNVEVEDLLRETLVSVAKETLGWDVTAQAALQASRPIIDVFAEVVGASFSKYRLAKSYVRWTRDHTSSDLAAFERSAWSDLIEKINTALK